MNFYQKNAEISRNTDNEIFTEAHIRAELDTVEQFQGETWIDESGVKINGEWDDEAEKFYLGKLQEYCEEAGRLYLVHRTEGKAFDLLFIAAEGIVEAIEYAEGVIEGKIAAKRAIERDEYLDFPEYKRVYGYSVFEIVVKHNS